MKKSWDVGVAESLLQGRRDPGAALRLLSASLHDADSFAFRSLSLLIKLKRCEIAKGT